MRIKVFKVTKTISSLRNFLIFYIYFFLRKDFERTKAASKKQLTKQKLANSTRVKVACFSFWCSFYAQNLFFFKKKKKKTGLKFA